ncbi:MAG: response regulator [Ruminococcaceae bacterium]|nr:response regulator [Oscillospiraceae bacterium]
MNRLHRRLLESVALGAVALVAVCAWISVALYTENARAERIEVAIGAAQQVVNTTDPRLVDVYLERGRAAQSYEEVRKILQGIRDNTPYLEYVYMYRIEEDGCHVVFDTEPEGVEADEPGTVIPFDQTFMPYVPTLLAGGRIDPIESNDTYGWLLTVYQPIYDMDGVCVAYAGVDMSMEDLNVYVKDFLLRVVLIASAFLVFSLAVGMRMSGSYHDIIRRQYAQIKEAKEEADYANQAKSHFLANMSHEIRTPINAVLGMNEMILRESEDDNVLGYSENIKTAGNTLLGIINDILDFSKIEAGKMEILPVDYDISSVLNDLVNMIQTRADDKGLVLKLDFDESTPRLLHGDEVRIKQVVTNILTNAVKYTEKGSVTFHVGYKRIEDEPESVYLDVSVRDTGIGIKPEDMAKLFSEFERIEEKRNRNVEGTGLGMNITKRLLEMMGSRLEVASVYGEGSVFSFRLKQKVVQWDALGDYEASYRASLSGRKRYREKFTAPDAEVLVVDDTPMNLAVLKSLLKRTGVRIDTAASGDEGLRLASGKKYDVIFLDHMMPEKDGIETLHELRAEKENPNLQTPTICLTANAISGAREQYLAVGFDDYLTKPIDPDRLEELMLQYLPKEKLLAPGDNAAMDTPCAEVPDWLRAIDGLDAGQGLSHCGTVETYLDTLTIYGSNAADSADEIEALWRAGDLANTTVKVHAIKSLSRTIGAEGIGALAEKLEYAGKAGDADALGAELPDLLRRVRALSAALAPLCASDEAAEDESLPLLSDEALQEAYDGLRELAANMDADSAAFVFDYLAGFRIPQGERERVEKLKRAVKGFDWEQVNELLRQQDGQK